jgi:hypothetical protein
MTLTNCAGGKCGSTFIDGNFKAWLKIMLGDRHYAILDERNASQKISSHATESGLMRKVMSEFDVLKKTFNPSRDKSSKKFDLPEGTDLETLNVGDTVRDGVLTITRSDYIRNCVVYDMVLIFF